MEFRSSPGIGVCAVAGCVALTWSGFAQGAALENSVPQPVRLLYQKGTYAELGFVYVDPHQSGDDATAGGQTLLGNTGDVFKPRTHLYGALKGDINEQFSYLFAIDQPYAVDTEYGAGSFPLGLPYDGTSGKVDSYQLTGVLAYDVTPRIKAYAGLRAENLDASVTVPFVAGYSIDTDHNWGYGYLLGAAYARPELGLRVALTYFSGVDHSLDSTEFSSVTGAVSDNTDIDTPQSATLDLQTGISPKTLVFGSIRWVDWSEFNVSPEIYVQLSGLPLVAYEDDWWTYTAGVGRRLTEDLAASVFIAYEPDVGGTMTSLGPYDGRTIGTAALSYDIDKFNILGAVSYGVLGDTSNRLQTDFNDGSVWGVSMRVGYTF